MAGGQQRPELRANGPALVVLPILADTNVATIGHLSAEFLVSDDPEVAHQLRVALRRLRALLWAYRPLLSEEFAEHWRQTLGEVATVIGNARDWDIILQALATAVPPEHPSLPSLLQALEQASEHARHEGRHALAVLAPSQLVANFRVAMIDATTAEAGTDKPLGAFAQARVDVASRRLDKQLDRALDGSMKELHRTRIQIKRLRYVLEYFSPLLAKAEHKRVLRLTSLQDALGELNDAVVGGGLLSEFPEHPEYTAALEAFKQWLLSEKKARRDKAVHALRQLAHKH